jgi:hypothetical protein
MPRETIASVKAELASAQQELRLAVDRIDSLLADKIRLTSAATFAKEILANTLERDPDV